MYLLIMLVFAYGVTAMTLPATVAPDPIGGGCGGSWATPTPTIEPTATPVPTAVPVPVVSAQSSNGGGGKADPVAPGCWWSPSLGTMGWGDGYKSHDDFASTWEEYRAKCPYLH
jgi:hypothetical protein